VAASWQSISIRDVKLLRKVSYWTTSNTSRYCTRLEYTIYEESALVLIRYCNQSANQFTQQEKTLLDNIKAIWTANNWPTPTETPQSEYIHTAAMIADAGISVCKFFRLTHQWFSAVNLDFTLVGQLYSPTNRAGLLWHLMYTVLKLPITNCSISSVYRWLAVLYSTIGGENLIRQDRPVYQRLCFRCDFNATGPPVIQKVLSCFEHPHVECELSNYESDSSSAGLTISDNHIRTLIEIK